MSVFARATKKKQKARVALIGPPGSGKTYTALTIAKHLGARIAVIDTERGSASKYAGDVAAFDVCEPETFAPDAYIAALRGAAAEGYDVVVIDSLSHSWEGEGGILDQVDQRGGKFDAWRDMTPQTRELIEAILGYPGHVVATMRVKTEYVVEKNERTGKMEPRKVGLAPKFKEGLEYEFDVVGMLDEQNVLTVTKSRARALNRAVVKHPGKPFADALLAWLEDGVEQPRPAPRTNGNGHPSATRTKLEDCTNAAELEAFACKYADAIRGTPARIRKVVDAAGRFGVADVAIVEAWLGMPPHGEVLDERAAAIARGEDPDA